jgi:hypothetical protein
MLLINHVLNNPELPADEDHKVKRLYIKRKGPGVAAPTGHVAYSNTFMRDARTNAPSHAQSAAAWAATREFKQLSWFQKNILCMNVEIHQENHQAYVERKSIMDTQQQILHHLSGSQSLLPFYSRDCLFSVGRGPLQLDRDGDAPL